jgi:hypothetical protein
MGIAYPNQHFPARLWQPLTNAEYGELARLLPLSSLPVAKNVGLMSAWPARHFLLPHANLSERAKALAKVAIIHESDLAGTGKSLFSHAGRLARACQRLLRIAAHGNRGDWRVK